MTPQLTAATNQAASSIIRSLERKVSDQDREIVGLQTELNRLHSHTPDKGFIQTPPGSLGGELNPYSQIAMLLVVQSDAQMGWITDANQLFCSFVNWHRGELGDPRDPECLTNTLIGKPLDVLVPPRFRKAHRFFRMAFAENPEPRTMGEGRDTPIWVKDDITDTDHKTPGIATSVIIGLSALDQHHTLAMVQPLSVQRSFVPPESSSASRRL